MEFENIIDLIKAVSSSELTEFELRDKDLKLSLKKTQKTVQVLSENVVPQTVVSAPAQAAPQTEAASVSGNVVKSPLVGTFYASASPDSDAFVKVGDTVTKGQTLGIIEAMKLMNEIESEFAGVVKEILVENEQLIEYGQPLFVIE